MASEVIVTADKIHKRKKRMSRTKIILLILFLLLLAIFLVLYFTFSVNRFTISIDQDLRREKGIVIYTDLFERAEQRKLYADAITNMDNICGNVYEEEWAAIQKNESGGSHNGKNYIAYTFYIENQGSVGVNYWYTIEIDDVIKGVDEATWVGVYHNDDEPVFYAKKNMKNGGPEQLTGMPSHIQPEEYYSDDVVVLKQRPNFGVGDIDKFTIVIFLEGDDPDCIDGIIGGEIMMHMEIREEHLKGE